MHEQEKLDEARHFLSGMIASVDQPKAFRYELSAFLASARSALQYARKESEAKPGGQAWYDAQVCSVPLIKFLKGKRNISIHQQPVVPSTSVNIAVNTAVYLSEQFSLKASDPEGRVIKEVTSTPELPP